MSKKAFVFAHFTRQNTFFSKNAENQRAKLIFSKWAKILLFNFGLFQQVFDNLKLNNLTKQARRLKLEDRIWRLKLEKRSFWPILRDKTLTTVFWIAELKIFRLSRVAGKMDDEKCLELWTRNVLKFVVIKFRDHYSITDLLPTWVAKISTIQQKYTSIY